MALPNYPNNPQVNDTFLVGNKTFQWDGEKWKALSNADNSLRTQLADVDSTVLVGGVEAGKIAKTYSGSALVDNFGAVGDGVTDDSAAINFCLQNFRKVEFSADKEYLIRSPIRPRTFNLLEMNNSHLITDQNNIDMLVLDNCLYATVQNGRIYPNAGCTGVRFSSTNSGLSTTQFCKMYNIDIEGEGRANTVSLELDQCWSNQFYSCNFLRTSVGVVIGELGQDQSTNANHFYGCEARSVNTVSGSIGVVHNSGDNNAWIGGIIENWEVLGEVNGGSFVVNTAYLEAASAARAFTQNGGQFTLTDNFNNFATQINGGDSFRISGHHFIASTLTDPTPAYNPNFPAIRVSGDIPIKIEVDLNVDPDFVYVIRENEYWDGSAWQMRNNSFDKINWIKPRFSIRLASDLNGVTGDGTVYNMVFGNNTEFVSPASIINASGTFTAPINGFYNLACQLNLSGLVAGSNVTMRIVTSNRTYNVNSSGVGDTTTGGNKIFSGECFAYMQQGDTARVQLIVSQQAGGSVDVLRGSAVDGFTTFQGFKV